MAYKCLCTSEVAPEDNRWVFFEKSMITIHVVSFNDLELRSIILSFWQSQSSGANYMYMYPLDEFRALGCLLFVPEGELILFY